MIMKKPAFLMSYCLRSIENRIDGDLLVQKEAARGRKILLLDAIDILVLVGISAFVKEILRWLEGMGDRLIVPNVVETIIIYLWVNFKNMSCFIKTSLWIFLF